MKIIYIISLLAFILSIVQFYIWMFTRNESDAIIWIIAILLSSLMIVFSIFKKCR